MRWHLNAIILNTKFPFIFKMVCGDNADLKKLKFMLDNITSIKNNKLVSMMLQ